MNKRAVLYLIFLLFNILSSIFWLSVVNVDLLNYLGMMTCGAASGLFMWMFISD